MTLVAEHRSINDIVTNKLLKCIIIIFLRDFMALTVVVLASIMWLLCMYVCVCVILWLIVNRSLWVVVTDPRYLLDSQSQPTSRQPAVADDTRPSQISLPRSECACSMFYWLVIRSTSKSRPNNIRGGKNVRPYVRPSVHKKFLRFEWNLVYR